MPDQNNRDDDSSLKPTQPPNELPLKLKLGKKAGLPFAAGNNRKIAVKIIGDRKVESLKVLNLE